MNYIAAPSHVLISLIFIEDSQGTTINGNLMVDLFEEPDLQLVDRRSYFWYLSSSFYIQPASPRYRANGLNQDYVQ
jgi:hypothetical protein